MWSSLSQLYSLAKVTILSVRRAKKDYKVDGGNLHLGPFGALISKFKTAHLKRTFQKKTAENDWEKASGGKKNYCQVPTRKVSVFEMSQSIGEPQ